MIEHEIRTDIDEHADYCATAAATTIGADGLYGSSDRDIMLLVLHELTAIRRLLSDGQ